MPPLSGGCERGVSLAEALVAAAILAFIGVVMVYGIYMIVQTDNVTRTNMLAEGLARYELEYVKSVSDNYSNIPVTNLPWSYTIPGGPYPKWDTSHNTLSSGYTGYTVTVSGALLTASPYLSDTGIQQVTATVTYGGKQKAKIAEYIAKY